MVDEGEAELEKYRKSKKYKDHIANFQRKLHFNKRFRNGIRKDFTELQEHALDALEKLPFNDSDIQVRKTRAFEDKLLDLAGEYIETCNRLDREEKERELKNSKFKLYKNKKTKMLIFLCSFYKVFENKNKMNTLLVFGGLGEGRRKAQLIRSEYDVDGLKLIDKGRFSIKFSNFDDALYKFRGEKMYNLRVTQRGKTKDNWWVELLS